MSKKSGKNSKSKKGTNKPRKNSMPASKRMASKKAKVDSGPVLTIQSSAHFEQKVLQSDKPYVVDFWAEWCGPCKQIAPALEELAIEYEGQITIAKVNVDENPVSPSKFGVRGIPALFLFKNGEMVSSKVGASPKASLQSWIEENK